MLPYSLDLLSDCLTEVHVPAEPFDPNGEWEHNYTIWNPARAKFGAKSQRAGSFRIRRRLTPGGNIRLQLTQTIQMARTNGSGISNAGVTCRPDDLATPMQWKIDFKVVDPQGRQVPRTAVSVSGKAEKIKVSGRLSSNWSLFDAVQRLPFDCKTLEFTLMAELELPKPDQRLSPGAAAEVELGGRIVKLRSFEQIGRGILPITYWLDDNHRLLVATGGRRSYLLEAAGGGKK